jgi:uncharacterized protein with HEPN domain
VSQEEELLEALSNTLDELEQLLDLGRANFDSNSATRYAIQRLWILGGECAYRYCDATDTDRGIEPWSSLCGLRNFLAHHLSDEISDDRVWEESVQDLPDIRAALEEL